MNSFNIFYSHIFNVTDITTPVIKKCWDIAFFFILSLSFITEEIILFKTLLHNYLYIPSSSQDMQRALAKTLVTRDHHIQERDENPPRMPLEELIHTVPSTFQQNKPILSDWSGYALNSQAPSSTRECWLAQTNYAGSFPLKYQQPPCADTPITDTVPAKCLWQSSQTNPTSR